MDEPTLPDENVDHSAEQHLAGEHSRRNPPFGDLLLTFLPTAAIRAELNPASSSDITQPNDTPFDNSVPSFIGEYRILRTIGRGGMGVVYEARHEALRRTVAVKVLSSHLGNDEDSRSRFFIEAQAAASLHHTNIVPVFGVGEYQGQCYYVMQYIPSRGLDDVIEETAAQRVIGDDSSDSDPMSPTEYARWVARIGFQVADALAHAHAQGILHRDIKPSNLLLDDDDTIWVADFGLAKITGNSDLTPSGGVFGTLRYMSPERFVGRSEVRGDVYSLGLTLHELITLQAAFDDTSADRMIARITQEGPIPPRQIDPTIPKDLETIIVKAIARDPDQRYATAKEMAEDLRRFLEDRPILARRIGPLQWAWRWCRRNPALAITTVTAFLLMVAITAISLIAYAETREARRRENIAFKTEKEQRLHAEKSATLALQAMNRIYEQFAPTRFVVTASTDVGEGNDTPRPTLPPEAIPLLNELLKTYDEVAESASRYERLYEQAAEARFRIGDIFQRLGDLERANEAYRSAITIYTGLVAGDPDTFRTRLARAYNELGRSLKSMQQFAESRRTFELAVRVLDEASSELAQRPECRYELAYAYYMLDRPSFFGKKGLRKESDERATGLLQTRARAILEPLFQEFPDEPEIEFLLACANKDADTNRAQKLLTELVNRFPDVPDYRLQLAETLNRFGPPEPRDSEKKEIPTSERQETLSRLRQAIEHSVILATRYPTVPDYRAARARYLDHLGKSLFLMGEYRESEKKCREAVTLQKELCSQYPKVLLYGLWLSLMEKSLGETLTELGNDSEARPLLESSIQRAEKLYAENPQLDGVHQFLDQAYGVAAGIYTRGGEEKLAEEMQRRNRKMGGKEK